MTPDEIIRQMYDSREVLKRYAYRVPQFVREARPPVRKIPLGCTTPYYLQPTFGDSLAFLAKHGYETVQIQLGGITEEQYDKILADKCASLKELEKKHNLRITATMSFGNMASADATATEKVYTDVRKAILVAEELGATTCVTASAFELPDRPLKDIWADFIARYSALADFAKSHNVKLAIEMARNRDRKCIVYNVPTCKMVIDSIPGDTVGINLDAANFVWMGIDTNRFIRTFGDRIHGVHAKNCEIFRDILADYGNSDAERVVWWRYRSAGYGELDYRGVISTLREVGYQGDIHVEPEDPIFSREEDIAKSAAYFKPMLDIG